VNFEVDAIITNRKHIPLVPEGYDIVDLGIGKSFIQKYMKQYKILTVTTQD
jgi:hypothetical protein